MLVFVVSFFLCFDGGDEVDSGANRHGDATLWMLRQASTSCGLWDFMGVVCSCGISWGLDEPHNLWDFTGVVCLCGIS